LSTKYVSRLGLTKSLEALGANYKCSQTREQMIYAIEGRRLDFIQGAQFLIPVVCYPQFKPHEVHDEKDRLQVDRDLYLQSMELQLNDILHEAAFKGGLSRSLSASDEMIKRLCHRQMYTYHTKYYTPENVSLVGIGCNHQTLVQLADKFKFSPDDTLHTPGFGNLKPIDEAPEASKYKGGEIRHNKQTNLVHIALACEGVSWSDNNLIASGLMSTVMGTGPQIKWSAGASRLQKAASAVAEEPCLVSSFNLHYSDNGLFGVHIICHKNDSGKVVKAVWSEFSKVLKSGITEEELNIAKKKLDVELNMKMEHSENVLDTMILNPELSDRITDIQAIGEEIKKISLDKINQFAKKLLSNNSGQRQSVTMASIGNLKNVPYLDDLRQPQ